MTAYVCLLRGVNLGPSTQMSMPELKRVCADLGLGSVTTYIRSGNVVFTSDDDTDTVRTEVEAGIERHFGVPVDVVMRTAGEMAAVVAGNPFPDADPARVSVAFLGAPVATRVVQDLGATDFGVDEYAGEGAEIYLHTPHGFGRSKLATRVSTLRRPAVATVRNWRTVNKLAQMSAALQD
jgi:uncharacterized protein (DUF1697 family)